jgi:hypothetical protein
MRVSIEDVQRVAADVLDDRTLATAVIGPLAEDERLVREVLHF